MVSPLNADDSSLAVAGCAAACICGLLAVLILPAEIIQGSTGTSSVSHIIPGPRKRDSKDAGSHLLPPPENQRRELVMYNNNDIIKSDRGCDPYQFLIRGLA
ncbi:hypothetical protein R1flu_028021 [Riccia fluitans]|uniref:Uncharacterized protein n=1 Tax=Riccia fluitans TaxID=41844 RepID=A0ABD1XPI1_9MARC